MQSTISPRTNEGVAPQHTHVMGFPVCTETRQVCIEVISDWVRADANAKYLACANPHSIEKALKDPLFERAIKEADIVIPDGMGLVWTWRFLGAKIPERVAGADIFLGLSDVLNRSGNHSYFFLGASEATLNKIVERMQRDFPSIRVAGVYSPPFAAEFTDAENRSMIDAINRAEPDVLWVGMTAPKQEKWIYAHKDDLDVKFIAAVGAVFDFYAGTVRRPHPWFLEHGLEWLPRLLLEPRRLWKRMLISAPMFVARAVLYHIRSAKN
jgi:N-acetylglucosaminyldiphosphoundecaprenol N-acetyl-beta-D-mannosaminyltransferase